MMGEHSSNEGGGRVRLGLWALAGGVVRSVWL